MSSIASEARPRKRKAKIETRAERIATMEVTVRPARENHQPFSDLWKFEQGHPDQRLSWSAYDRVRKELSAFQQNRSEQNRSSGNAPLIRPPSNARRPGERFYADKEGEVDRKPAARLEAGTRRRPLTSASGI